MEYWIKIIGYLISFLLICFLGSVFLMNNEDCPECLKTNKATHIGLIVSVLILTYFNVVGFALSFVCGLLSYIISNKIIGGK